MKRLIAATALAVIVTAGCSSSVDNPPDVRPTDPTTGNLAPPSTTTLSANRVLFSPNQGILPYPHDAYFTPTAGVPTDGTLNLPSSAFFPATLRLPSGVTEPVVNALDGFSTQAPIKLRFSTADQPRLPPPPASGSSKCTSIRPPRRRSASPPPRARCVACWSRAWTTSSRPRLTSTPAARSCRSCRCARCLPTTTRRGADSPARYRLPGAGHQRAARRERRAPSMRTPTTPPSRRPRSRIRPTATAPPSPMRA